MKKTCLFIVLATSTCILTVQPRPALAVDPGTLIGGASLALQILSGIETAVKGVVRARVDAQADSIGPDVDDFYTIAVADEFDGLFSAEWNLDAWTSIANATGTKLGPNGGDPHIGFARMEVERDFGSAGWQLKQSYAFADAAKDTTPVAGSDNLTAAAAVSTFSINGTVQKAWTKVSNSFAPSDGIDITGTVSSVVKWTLPSFTAESAGDYTLITPPLDSADLGHIFMQLPASPNFRDRYVQLLPSIGPSLALLDTKADSFLETLPFGISTRADFTIAAGKLNMLPMSILTENKSKTDLIKEYLLSSAVSVAAPGNAQYGYLSTSSKLLIEDSGLLGLSIDIYGSFSNSLNLAEVDPAHPLYAQLNQMNVGENVDLELAFSTNSSAMAFDQETVAVPAPLPILGIGALFGYSRKLRNLSKRLKSSKLQLNSPI